MLGAGNYEHHYDEFHVGYADSINSRTLHFIFAVEREPVY